MNYPHGKDLRKGRFSQLGGVYFLTFVTVGCKKVVFRSVYGTSGGRRFEPC